MIYRANNPLVLTEDAADSFLESVGVRLFEDEISINGTLYEGAYGEEILAENGIFLYEDGIVLEGEQAEEYKARKKADAEKGKNEINERNRPYKYQYGTTKGKKYPGYNKYRDEDRSRSRKADDMIARTRDRHYGDSEKHLKNAQDAIHRAHVFQSKLVDLNKSTPYDKRKTPAYKTKEKRYSDTVKKHYGRYLDAEGKSNKSFDQGLKTHDNDVYRSTMRHLKNQERIAKSKKQATNESTIFSDIEII